jgi:hypothetical protein
MSIYEKEFLREGVFSTKRLGTSDQYVRRFDEPSKGID